MEDQAAWKIREVVMKTSVVLEQQRHGIFLEVAYELGMQENKPCEYSIKFGTTFADTVGF